MNKWFYTWINRIMIGLLVCLPFIIPSIIFVVASTHKNDVTEPAIIDISPEKSATELPMPDPAKWKMPDPANAKEW